VIRRPFLRPVAALLGALCLVSGCHSWKQEPVSATALSERQMSSARVRLAGGRQLMIVEPRVVGDSLVGRVDSVEPGPASLPRLTTSTRVAVALASVSSVETRHLNGWKTAGVAGGLALGLIVLIGATWSPCYFCEEP
jgi:hypothetical protein